MPSEITLQVKTKGTQIAPGFWILLFYFLRHLVNCTSVSDIQHFGLFKTSIVKEKRVVCGPLEAFKSQSFKGFSLHQIGKKFEEIKLIQLWRWNDPVS